MLTYFHVLVYYFNKLTYGVISFENNHKLKWLVNINIGI